MTLRLAAGEPGLLAALGKGDRHREPFPRVEEKPNPPPHLRRQRQADRSVIAPYVLADCVWARPQPPGAGSAAVCTQRPGIKTCPCFWQETNPAAAETGLPSRQKGPAQSSGSPITDRHPLSAPGSWRRSRLCPHRAPSARSRSERRRNRRRSCNCLGLLQPKGNAPPPAATPGSSGHPREGRSWPPSLARGCRQSSALKASPPQAAGSWPSPAVTVRGCRRTRAHSAGRGAAACHG